MTLFRLIVFKITVTAAFALQIEAPEEIAEHVSEYSNAIAPTQNAILKVNITKNTHCNTYTLQLIDKKSKKVEFCSADLPNAALQNAVFEVFGHKNINNSANSSLRTALIGVGFITAGILLYYSNPPKPVYGGKK